MSIASFLPPHGPGLWLVSCTYRPRRDLVRNNYDFGNLLNDADLEIFRQHGPEHTESLAVAIFCYERRIWPFMPAVHQDDDAV